MKDKYRLWQNASFCTIFEFILTILSISMISEICREVKIFQRTNVILLFKVTTMILSYVFVLIKFGLTLEYNGHAKISHFDEVAPKNVSTINYTSISNHAL